jgi:uncharacterized protein YkwD
MTAAAATQARVVARDGELSHGDFSGRISAYGVDAAAENLGMGPTTLEGAIALWKASPAHNANLLSPTMTRIGVARADSDAPFWAMVLAK